MNKKPTILAVAALGSLALIGTGFAGWVIAANAQTAADGTITAYTVTDNRLEIAADPKASWDHDQIIFGKLSDVPETAYNWFGFEDDVENQILVATYTVTVKSNNDKDTAPVTAKPKVGVREGDSSISGEDEAAVTNAKNAWDDAVKKGYVVEPTVKATTTGGTTEGDNATGNLQGGKIEFKFTVTFNWGAKFEKDNPYKYYNAHDVNEKLSGSETTYGSDAKETLNTLAKISEAKFRLNISFERGK